VALTNKIYANLTDPARLAASRYLIHDAARNRQPRTLTGPSGYNLWLRSSSLLAGRKQHWSYQ
jgi:hypothetical protein